MAQRFIGIRHRVKKTAAGEARPTQVVFLEGDDQTSLDLLDDQAELDFVRGVFPTSFRSVKPTDKPADFPVHHLQWKKAKFGVSLDFLPKGFLRKVDNDVLVLDKVPASYNGLREGDMVGMILGGSGDRLAAALSRRGEEVGATVWRVPPKDFSTWREGDGKDEDAAILASSVRDKRVFFYQVEPRDRALIRVAEALNARQEALAARIACEQRLHASFIGSVFLAEDGFYPEGQIEDEFNRQSASDVILQNLEKELARRERGLKNAVEDTALWDKIFKPIEGVGPRLAASFIAAIADIRRFSSDAKLKKFCGVHVMDDGSFPRQRHGQVANWNPSLRQALYLLGDQFNRRPESTWGKKLLYYKAKMRETHPEPVMVEVLDHKTRKSKMVKRYSDGHIHRMATWRTLTKFVQWLYAEWWKLENEYQIKQESEAA